MTTEEKAKAYDGLIERLKDLKFAYRFSPLSDTIEEKFPELNESEDERIRKWLIGYFNQYIIDGMPQVFGNGLNVKDVIAWLEKQGEQNLLDKIAKQVTKDKETATSFLRFTGIINENGELAEPYRVCESISNWSEEDESRITTICTYLQDYARLSGSESRTIRINEYCDWLKSLKDRIQPKPMFNEKMDIEVWNSTNGQYILKVNGNVIRGQWYDDAILIYKHFFYLSEIESLKPKNTWKPSEEQMEALDIAIRCGIQLGTWEEEALKSLKEQLRKLKEK